MIHGKRRYISHEEAERTADPWRLVRLRLSMHEMLIASPGHNRAEAFNSRNRLFEAIAAWAKNNPERGRK